MKATYIAHPIQGLIKYHGLKDSKLRIPFHDSISVCLEGLYTITTVEADEKLKEDIIILNGKRVLKKDGERILKVIKYIKTLADYSGHFKIVSKNSIIEGKGLGFSASGFAALGLATSASLNLKMDYITLSESIRLGAGSATRSLAGGFAIWYANKDGESYAEQLVYKKDTNFTMIVIPIFSKFKTDEAHSEVLSSPLFEARLKKISLMIDSMKEAIRKDDISDIGKLAEEDSLNLHAITMTGKSHIIFWEPETISIIKEVVKMRNEGVPAWYSIDTGPSVFINTDKEYVKKIIHRLKKLKLNILVSDIGNKPKISNSHLF